MASACDFSHCCDSNNLNLFKCSGVCDKTFHAKCAKITQPIADRVIASDSGIYWYCVDCRKVNLFAMSFKISRMGDEFSRLTRDFLNVSKDLASLQDIFNKIKEFPNGAPEFVIPGSVVVTQKTPTSFPMPSPNTVIPSVTNTVFSNVTVRKRKVAKGLRGTNSTDLAADRSGAHAHSQTPCATSRSHLNGSIPALNQTYSSNNSMILDAVQGDADASKPNDYSFDHAPFVTLRRRKGAKKRKSVTTATAEPTNVVVPSFNAVDPSPVSSVPTNVAKSNCNNVVNVLRDLQAVTPSKILFISKLVKNVTPDDVLHHISNQLSINNALPNFNLDRIKCFKISKKNSFFSSFKISVPSEIFEYLSSPSIWPVYTFIKEFVPTRTRNLAAVPRSLGTPCNEAVLALAPLHEPKN